MQLHHFARQVFVQTVALLRITQLLALDQFAVGPDGSRLVQVEHHRRMADSGEEQVFKAAQHMGSNGLRLIGARQGRDSRVLDGHGEMVGPEMHQPLGERRGRVQRLRQAGVDGVEVLTMRVAGQSLAHRGLVRRRGLADGALALAELEQQVRCGGERGACPDTQGRRPALRQQPIARLARQGLVGPDAQTVAIAGDDGSDQDASLAGCGRLPTGNLS